VLTNRAIITGSLADYFLPDDCPALKTITAGAVVDQQFLGEITRSAI
jgi:hypothetical protein